MNIAKVIVDVPTMSINQTFDYSIPVKFSNVITEGMRVVIPFGPRKITGFVVGRKEHSDFENLKEIIDVLDLTPVLTKELMEIGKWLAKDTLCFYITAFQAMLPQVLKSTYKKELVRVGDATLSSELDYLFSDQDVIPFEKVNDSAISYATLQAAIQNNLVKVNYIVKSRVTKKYITMIEPARETSELKKELAKLPGNAHRQQQLLTFFIEHPVAIDQQQLINVVQTNSSSIKALIDKQLLRSNRIEVYRNPYDDDSFEKTSPLHLTEEQQKAITPIHQHISDDQHAVFLVHGVTGSGKTEIYLQAIEQVIQKGQEAIVLVPEISLTPQMVKRFKGRFGSQVAVLHSALSAGEKYDEWRRIHQKEVKVVVGARSAIFAPFENLGIIIIDEEHETTYKQEEQPRYHARDVAIYRGEYHNCPVVLGSATPTLESYARAQKGVYKLATLKKRTNEQEMPQVEIVDMREELHAGNRTMFSRVLKEKIEDRINRGEQIVLLLNRRGFSTFVMCRDCGHVEECPHCDIALTYHKRSNLLKCHYCSFETQVPTTCPECESDLIRFFGTGTQRVEETITTLIPEASVIRMDVDTTRRKGSHERLLTKFANREAHILLGTQMIAKGLDFGNVTLVGVLAADSMLHLPDFRASEKTFQLLTQVSGRAGRHELTGEVVVQTYTPDHYSIEFASKHNFELFYKEEMAIRRKFRYPPYVFMTLLTITHPNEMIVIQTSQRIVQLLHQHIHNDTVILGPTPSPIARIKNRYRYQCMIKYRQEPQLKTLISKILDQFTNEIERDDLQIIVDMQPYQLM